MSETNLIEVKMHGIEVKGTVQQIADLKKLLDEQNPIKVKFVPLTQPYPWVVQPYVYPQTIKSPYWEINKIMCETTSGNIGAIEGITSWNGDPKDYGNYGSTCNTYGNSIYHCGTTYTN